MCDVLTNSTVTTTRSMFQDTVLVHQAERYTIQLGLTAKTQLRNTQFGGIALFKRLYVLAAEGVIKAEHWEFVSNTLKLAQWLITYTLGWRCR